MSSVRPGWTTRLTGLPLTLSSLTGQHPWPIGCESSGVLGNLVVDGTRAAIRDSHRPRRFRSATDDEFIDHRVTIHRQQEPYRLGDVVGRNQF